MQLICQGENARIINILVKYRNAEMEEFYHEA